jgi:hypothetical protein
MYDNFILITFRATIRLFLLTVKLDLEKPSPWRATDTTLMKKECLRLRLSKEKVKELCQDQSD